MVKKLDDSVGDIVNALYEKGILENTIVVFTSDNGGMTIGNSMNYAVNWPLRGIKMSPFEGGVRVAGLIWSYSMNVTNHLWNGYMHMVDWVPTLMKAAGLEPPHGIDGEDQWQNIIVSKDGREEIFEIDDYTGFASIISGEYKLISGNASSEYCDYYGGDLRGIIGDGLDYTDVIKKSRLYSILEKVGKPFNIDDVNFREGMKVKCTEAKGDKCFPQNGNRLPLTIFYQSYLLIYFSSTYNTSSAFLGEHYLLLFSIKLSFLVAVV